ncbi:hypothetical protein ACF0H5_009457 [Mactra antiquata]
MRNYLRREILFWDRMNPFEYYDDNEFRRRFRFRKNSVMDLIRLVGDDIKPTSGTSGAILSHLQVLLTLRYYAI